MQQKTDRTPRVLVVEDDAVVRVYTERVVKKGAYEVVSASSGEEALQLLKEDNDIDIALMDIMMPGMSGFELLEALKAEPKTSNIRVIMLTALNQVEDKVRAFSSGASDYISKPFESKELLARLGTQIRLKTAEENLRQSEEMFKSLVTYASDVITVTDMEGKVVYTNEATCDLMGFGKNQEAVGMSVYDFFSPDSLEILAQARQDILSGGVITNQEFKLKHPDGRTIPVELTSSLIRDAEGQPLQFITITRDISERKLVEKAIHRRLEMEKILSSISSSFSSLVDENIDGRIAQALETVGNFVDVDRCVLFARNGKKARFFFNENAVMNTGISPFIVDENFSFGEYPWAEKQLKKNEALYVPDVDDLPSEAFHERELWKSLGIHSLIAIPLFIHDELVGLIMVVWMEKPHLWLDGDTRLLRLVGEIIINALERKRGQDSVRHFTERLEGMHAIDHAILTAQSAQAIASSALIHLEKLIPFFSAEVEYINLETEECELLASQPGNEVLVGEEHAAHTRGLLSLPPEIMQGEIHVVHDVQAQPLEYEIERRLQASGAASFILAPLIFYEQFTGVLILAAERTHVFLNEHLLVVREVSDMLALGIKNALLLKEARETVEREMRLDEVTRIISGTLDVDIILKEVVRLSRELVYADAGCFFMLSSDQQNVASCFQLGLPDDFESICHPQKWNLTRRSLCDHRSLVINDYSAEEETIDILLQQNVRRMLCVPVMASGMQMGLLLMFRKGNAKKFNSRDLWIIETVGRQAGAAIQNAMFYQSERHRVQELEAMSDIVADTLGELDLTTLLEAVVVRSVALLDTTGGELGLYDEKTQNIEILVSFGLDKDYSNTILKMGEGVMGNVASNHMPLMIKDYTSWHGHSSTYVGMGHCAVLAVPLIARKKLLGVLEVVDSFPGRSFGPEDMHLLNLFGAQAAIAMDNALLYKSAQQRAIEAETLQQVGAVVASKLNLNEAIDAILEQLARVIPNDSASVQLIRNKRLETVGGRGFSNQQDIMGVTYPLEGDGPNARVLQSGKPLIIDDCQYEYNELLPESKDSVLSWLGVPMVFQNRNIGMITLNSRERHHFTAEHIRMMSAYADQVAIAIENARLYEEAQRRAVEAETLRKAGAAVAAQLKSDAAIDSILEQLMMVVNCDNTSVQLVQGENMVVVGGHTRGDTPYPFGLSFPIKGDTPNAIVYMTRQPLILDDENKEYRQFIYNPQGNIRSWLGVPLIIHDEVIGLVAMGSVQPHYFNEEHARLVSAFADQVGIALENARLFEETQRLATTDPLTELYNRRHFFELSRVELERACRYRRQLSVMMLDIDRFKRVNDRFGHLMGDHVLRVIAQRIRSSLREIDVIGRYGGEEFVVLLPETGSREAFEAGERLRKTIADTPIEIGPENECITVSVGVVTLVHGEKTEIETLFDRADQSLYTAKQAGRNRVVVWNESNQQNGHISAV